MNVATMANLAEAVLGRRLLWRVGRRLYQTARRDTANDPRINGEYLLQERVVAYAHAKGPSLVAVDIGANVGDWSLHLLDAAARAGLKDVRLISVEPSPSTRSELQRRLAGARAGHSVEVVASAVTDHIGTEAFDADEGTRGTKRLHIAPTSEPTLQVPVTTLEAMLDERGLTTVDFVKCDVEGFDLKVLQGALPIFRKGAIGILQFEYNHRWVVTRTFLKDVFELARGTPYVLAKVVFDGLDVYPEWHPELERFFETNYALVREDLMGVLGARPGAFDAYSTYATVKR